MKLTKREKKILSEKYNGTELCPYCGQEFSFTIIPLNEIVYKCDHCGEESTICSLCNVCCNCNDCKTRIWESILEWNKEN